MNITFDFNGCLYQANVTKQKNNQVEVRVNDELLGKKFDYSLHYYLNDSDLGFVILNPSHSELFRLQNAISNATLQRQPILHQQGGEKK